MAVASLETIKGELHTMVDELAKPEAVAALDYLRSLLREDELTEEEWLEVRRGEAEIARGEYVTFEDLKRDLAG